MKVDKDKGVLISKIFVDNPKGFANKNNANMVCKLHKALYGLKQASRAWYERLHTYLVKIGFERTDDNNNLYMKVDKDKGVLISKIFVDDIIFGGQDALCKDFANQMKQEFEMSMFGEIKFFVGLQVN